MDISSDHRLMLHPYVLCGLCYLVFILVKYRNRAIGTSNRKDPLFPTLPGWPILGQLPSIFKNRKRSLEYSAGLKLKYGPGYSYTLPGTRLIDISKPEWIEYVQKTNFNNYVKGNLFQSVMSDVFGEGIFVVDGPKWKLSRHTISTIFTNKSFKSIIAPSTKKTMRGLVHVLDCAAEENRSLNFCDLFFRFTLDSFVQMTLGKDLALFSDLNNSSIEAESEKTAKDSSSISAASFVEAFDFVQNQIEFRFTIMKGWKLVEMLNFCSGKRMKESCRIINDFTYSLIDDRISHFSNQNIPHDDPPLDQSLLDLFITARDKRGGDLGRTELRDSLMNLIIAGRDTTAQALSWSFFHLLMNKEIISKIRQQVVEILRYDNYDHENQLELVSYENYKEFTWAYSVVLESLRLHPSVPNNVKCAISDDIIPDGPTIQAGNLVRWSDWQIGRDPSVWGPDCTEFKPDRWIDQNGSIKQFGQFKFHAFNGGPRVCLGMNLALYEAVKVIVEIFNRFDLEFSQGWLENVPKSETIKGLSGSYSTPMYRVSLTLPMKNPMMISVKLRSS